MQETLSGLEKHFNMLMSKESSEGAFPSSFAGHIFSITLRTKKNSVLALFLSWTFMQGGFEKSAPFYFFSNCYFNPGPFLNSFSSMAQERLAMPQSGMQDFSY